MQNHQIAIINMTVMRETCRGKMLLHCGKSKYFGDRQIPLYSVAMGLPYYFPTAVDSGGGGVRWGHLVI
jgi:hypothetical protein